MNADSFIITKSSIKPLTYRRPFTVASCQTKLSFVNKSTIGKYLHCCRLRWLTMAEEFLQKVIIHTHALNPNSTTHQHMHTQCVEINRICWSNIDSYICKCFPLKGCRICHVITLSFRVEQVSPFERIRTKMYRDNLDAKGTEISFTN